MPINKQFVTYFPLIYRCCNSIGKCFRSAWELVPGPVCHVVFIFPAALLGTGFE
ncbi:hypothetical protein DM47_2805 [Burkholderia mallei]|nr:hypothetical protein DM75_3416 [Burkholderia mallei]KGD54165.1 hypothetical protein DP49_3072 [Burkholderia pseudomallei]KOS75049.1 hypothetical protein DM46_725 [Burkholderia mallei]KOS85547.1 hypothetical protein DM45_3774 [Burkholderia mallei]KOS91201.1 hypothetical protein DM49_4020 [Burkholderia mallei]